jgi:hypothetical protein
MGIAVGFRVSRAVAGLASGGLILLMGCAVSGGGGSVTPPPVGNTHATLLITSTNNAQIPIFNFNLEAVTLLQRDGTAVPVMTTAQMVELGSANGVAHPLVSVDVPQGSYSSVKLTYGPSTFVVIDQSEGDGSIDLGSYNLPSSGGQSTTVTETLSSPLEVTGGAMGLLLNLNIPSSTTFTSYFAGSSNFEPGGGDTTFNPVFSLTGVTIAAQPSTLEDGLVEDVHGQVTASGGGTLTMTEETGSTLSFEMNGSTLFAGPNGTAAPAVGSFVDVDAALENDGSMMATRVQTEGAETYNLIGQVVEDTSLMYVMSSSREQQGPSLPNGTGFYGNNVLFSGTTQFEIAWPNGAAPTGLPFTPSLNASLVTEGQNLATPVASQQWQNHQIPAVPTATLEPQTIDAMVAGVSTAGGVTTYQVSLFPDDLTAIFGKWQTMTVYATADTRTITTTPLASGTVGRFRGLLFNDGGTLRMVAREVEDGVPGS